MRERLRFQNSGKHWWQKPLVIYQGSALPAELAVLRSELKPDEEGLWLNSRSRKPDRLLSSGVLNLVVDPSKRSGYRTERRPVPVRVAEILQSLCRSHALSKGVPDLVIWNSSSVRFLEVKCPHWDRPSSEQQQFLSAAREAGFKTSVVEWEFIPYGASNES